MDLRKHLKRGSLRTVVKAPSGAKVVLKGRQRRKTDAALRALARKQGKELPE